MLDLTNDTLAHLLQQFGRSLHPLLHNSKKIFIAHGVLDSLKFVVFFLITNVQINLIIVAGLMAL